jgi:hypothetical protein
MAAVAPGAERRAFATDKGRPAFAQDERGDRAQLSQTLDVRTLQKKFEKLSALSEEARHDKATGNYWMDADDWRELRGLIASSVEQVQAELGEERPGHDFALSGDCIGCGMAESYYKGAMAVLEGWPEDSEKDERMAELVTCKHDLKGPSRPK